MRGEYGSWIVTPAPDMELPPRARRIRHCILRQGDSDRTTSACAENTGRVINVVLDSGNYLRVRGEYIMFFATTPANTELPPRARRILIAVHRCEAVEGTTSACAENTLRADLRMNLIWNYLRVRGEYPTMPWILSSTRELPPRARRIHRKAQITDIAGGTTSACAENTLFRTLSAWLIRNYLRVRGEYNTMRISVG